MYTKQEISKQKQAFWTAFGKYMKPILSADGEEIGWINYKTGNKQVSFRMDVEDWPAIISFLKPRIIALDEFWSMVRPTLSVGF